MAQSKKAAKATTTTTALVTGLGETLPQIEKLTGEKAKALLEIVKLGKKAPVNDLLNAAYQYGLCERRRRKLARKVNGSKDDE